MFAAAMLTQCLLETAVSGQVCQPDAEVSISETELSQQMKGRDITTMALPAQEAGRRQQVDKGPCYLPDCFGMEGPGSDRRMDLSKAKCLEGKAAREKDRICTCTWARTGRRRGWVIA